MPSPSKSQDTTIQASSSPPSTIQSPATEKRPSSDSIPLSLSLHVIPDDPELDKSAPLKHQDTTIQASSSPPSTIQSPEIEKQQSSDSIPLSFSLHVIPDDPELDKSAPLKHHDTTIQAFSAPPSTIQSPEFEKWPSSDSIPSSFSLHVIPDDPELDKSAPLNHHDTTIQASSSPLSTIQLPEIEKRPSSDSIPLSLSLHVISDDFELDKLEPSKHQDTTMQAPSSQPATIQSTVTEKRPSPDSIPLSISLHVIPDIPLLVKSEPPSPSESQDTTMHTSSSPTIQSPVTEKRPSPDSIPLPLSPHVIPNNPELKKSARSKVKHPSSPENCLRRSGRCTSNVYKTEKKISSFELIEGKLGKSERQCRSEGNAVSKRSLRSRTVVVSDSPLSKSPRLSPIKRKLLALPDGPLKKAKVDRMRRGSRGGENENKEDNPKSCLIELSDDDQNLQKIERNGDSLGQLKKCSKSGISSFDVLVGVSYQETVSFVGEPVLEEEAQQRWGWRYELRNKKVKQQCRKLNEGEEDEIILNVKCHYTQAKVNNCIINLGDCALIKGDGTNEHVGKILEFFQTTDDEDYFRVQWFYRAEDTVLQKQAALHDKKRLFYSTVMNDNLLDCIISKVSINRVAPTLSSQHRWISSDFYYDMEYSADYSTFRNLPKDDPIKSCELVAPGVSEALKAIITSTPLEEMPSHEPHKAELALLDLYSGCGGMSTGLCLGAKLSSVNLVTRWAVDANQDACDSLKLNHPETTVRKENAEDFLELLKEWEKLCQRYVLSNLDKSLRSRAEGVKSTSNVQSPRDVKSPGEYEVQCLVDICFGDPNKTGKREIHFKVRWLGYGSSDDTWEPIDGLSNCQERIEEFVRSGHKSKIVPLPGDVHVLCGGPPCQGISGYNRHRNIVSPLTDEKNRQLIVFMDIVKFLKPKYVLMENVNDILKLDKASLGRYALSRLIHMKYQARLGSMASGCYGLPQFRLRVFLWGALPSEKLPQFPLPTHDVVVKYWPAVEFERNTVAYDEGQHRDLEEAVVLRDAISDLQAVTCNETREQMAYELPPETEFQKFIRLSKDEMMGLSGERSEDVQNTVLYDHRSVPLGENVNLRVSQIPHRKGANFRDLPGVLVGPDNVAYRDPNNVPKLPSGELLVPDSCFVFENGKSKRPYARVWWDETVATIVTYPNVRAMAVLHPEQDRAFTIRECARLQGFPDYYRFSGTVKERYRQVGNAVSVPVAKALGYCLGMAIRKLGGDEPLMSLPPKFTFQTTPTKEI